jgi:hypothetical protein
MVTPGVGAWPEGCWPKARRQQWRHFGTSAMLGIGCESYGVGVHILFPADNAPSGTRNSSKRFGGDLGGERRADGRTPGDYHVARKARFEAKAWDQSRTGFRGRRVVMSLAGGASAAGAQVADALTHKAVVSHEITLGEEEIADVSLATFYVFDKENAGPSRHSESLTCGCWTARTMKISASIMTTFG